MTQERKWHPGGVNALIRFVLSFGIRTGSSRHTFFATFVYLPNKLTFVSKAKKSFHDLCTPLDLNYPGYSSLQELFTVMETANWVVLVRNTNVAQNVLEGS